MLFWGNCMIFEFFSTYGTGSNKSITNKCNFDLIHGPSICLFCIAVLSLNFKMDLRNNAQWYFNDIFHENAITCFNVVHHFFNSRHQRAVLLHNIIFSVSPLKVTYAVIIIFSHATNINIELEWHFAFASFTTFKFFVSS